MAIVKKSRKPKYGGFVNPSFERQVKELKKNIKLSLKKKRKSKTRNPRRVGRPHKASRRKSSSRRNRSKSAGLGKLCLPRVDKFGDLRYRSKKTGRCRSRSARRSSYFA
jgi:hypothetical protein